MDAKIKAVELRKKFYDKIFDIDNGFSFTLDSKRLEAAKQCAIIAVQIVVDSNPLSPHDGSYYELTEDRVNTVIEYWQQVKIEIEAL